MFNGYFQNLTNIGRYLTDTENQFYKISVLLVKYRLYRLNIGSPRFLPSNLSLNNYSMEFTQTSTGGTLLYIANHLSHKSCNDLNIYKS